MKNILAKIAAFTLQSLTFRIVIRRRLCAGASAADGNLRRVNSRRGDFAL